MNVVVPVPLGLLTQADAVNAAELAVVAVWTICPVLTAFAHSSIEVVPSGATAASLTQVAEVAAHGVCTAFATQDVDDCSA
jgi:hypothetical protein